MRLQRRKLFSKRRSAFEEEEDADVSKNQCVAFITKVLPISNSNEDLGCLWMSLVLYPFVSMSIHVYQFGTFSLIGYSLNMLESCILKPIHILTSLPGDHYEPRGYFFMDVEDMDDSSLLGSELPHKISKSDPPCLQQAGKT